MSCRRWRRVDCPAGAIFMRACRNRALYFTAAGRVISPTPTPRALSDGGPGAVVYCPAGRSRRRPNEKRGKKEKGKVTICSANAIAPGRTSSPPAAAAAIGQLASTTTAREVVLEHTSSDGDRHRDPDTRRHGGACHPVRWASPGCASLSSTMERWSGTSVTWRKRCGSTVTDGSPAAVNPVLILCLKAISGW